MDYLRTIRTHHWVLMLLSGTALISSVVPQARIDYYDAYTSLRFLEGLERSQMFIYVQYRLTVLLGGDEHDQLSVVMSPPMDQETRLATSHLSAGTLTRLLRAAFPDEPSISFETATLSQIQTAMWMNVYLPVPRRADQLAALRECADTAEQYLDIQIAVEPTGSQRDFDIPGTDTNLAKVSIRGRYCMDLMFTPQRYGNVAFGPEQASDNDLVKAMRTRSFRPEPFETALALPDVSPWWLIESLTVAQAKQELIRRFTATDGAAVVLGFPLFRALIVLAVPALVLVTQLLMVFHIAAAARSDSISKADSAFAWIGVYPRSPELVADLSIIVLPAACVSFLWYASAVAAWKIVLLIMTSGTLGLSAVWQLRSLRSRLR